MTFGCVARKVDGMRLSALRLPLYEPGASLKKFFHCGSLQNSDAERVARTHFFYPPHDPRAEITLSLMTPSTKRLWNSNVFVLNGRFPIAPANVAGALRILCLAPSVVEQRRKCTQAVMSVGTLTPSSPRFAATTDRCASISTIITLMRELERWMIENRLNESRRRPLQPYQWRLLI